MDNITHSLAGLLVAESVVRVRARLTLAEPTPRFRGAAAIASVIAANLPDFDLLYTGFGSDRLRYMLHHRGYTHTVLAAVVGAVVLWALAGLALRSRARVTPTTGDHLWLLALLLVSTLSHLVLDWTNSYGVHPFWPIDDRWRYGDAVFIVEPWFWVVSVPVLVAASTRRWLQVVLSLVLAAGLTLAWRIDLVSRGAATALTIGAVLFVVMARRFERDARVVVAIAGWCAVTIVMAVGSGAVRRAVLRAVHEADAQADVLDVVVSPLPANAVCTSVVTVERSGATYRVATARASAAPAVTDALHCGTREGNIGSLMRPSARRSTRAVQWEGEWSAPNESLASLARRSCAALAALRFIRAPIWSAAGDSTVLLGDVRYGGGSGSGFTDVRVPTSSVTCPRAVPPWTPPRAELLGWTDDS
jgi:inner membrane protein